jgi:hypothetical protein
MARFLIFFFNFLVKIFLLSVCIEKALKPPTRLKLVSRGNNAAGAQTVRGLEPRAPGLEIPRPG